MTAEFEGKIKIVTGAGSGIGAEIARRLGTMGCRIVAADLNLEAADRVAKEIEVRGGIALPLQLDVTDPQAIEQSIRRVEERWGGLHLAVNNAGVPGCMESLTDHTIAEWVKVIGVNLSGVFYGMKYQIAAMLRSGGGAIVNMASSFGTVGTQGSAAYVAAKHGVVGLTKSAALDIGKRKLRA